MKTTKNKTLVTISREQAMQLPHSAVGFDSNGNYTTYQYHLDNLKQKKWQERN